MFHLTENFPLSEENLFAFKAIEEMGNEWEVVSEDEMKNFQHDLMRVEQS